MGKSAVFAPFWDDKTAAVRYTVSTEEGLRPLPG